ncbi:MAG: DUF503 domain-containing protein [Brevinematia bacterium]
MLIGTLQIHLSLPSRTLKEKRRIVNSLKDRTRSKFNASVAEVEYNDDCHNALIGIAVVSNNGNHLNSVLCSIIDFINAEFPGLMSDYKVEIL